MITIRFVARGIKLTKSRRPRSGGGCG